MNPSAVKQKGTTGVVTAFTPLTADTSDKTDNRVRRLQVLASGQWLGSWKGDVEVTVGDLQEMVDNFNKGVGLPNGGAAGAPVDYSHEDWKKAAGWVKELVVENGILYASVKFTPAAIQAIDDEEYLFFSPSLYPACFGTWSDPEDPTITARNVFMGGGLTNIPFFKALEGLDALKASQTPQGAGDSTLYVSKELIEEGTSMELSVVRAKQPGEIEAAEREFLIEHKAELTAAELIAFSLEEKETPDADKDKNLNADTRTEDQKKADQLQASVTAGTHMVVAKSEFDALKASVDTMQAERLEASKKSAEDAVKLEASRGKIKQDQIEDWTKRVVADATMLNVLKSLPENTLLASEYGSDSAKDQDAQAQFSQAVDEAMKADSKLSYSDAVVKVANANSDLANEREKALISK